MDIKHVIEKHYEQIRYLIVGGMTSVIGVGGYWLLVVLDRSPVIANVLSWIVAVAFAYIANKQFVFRDQTRGARQLVQQILSFVSSRVFSLIVETVLIWIGTDILQFNKYFIKIPVAVVVVILNYITGKFVVFKKDRK